MGLDAIADHGPVSPGRLTWARPRRMSASDGNVYVVKIRNGGGDSKSFFNELVASNIALMVGLPAAEPVIINLGAKFIKETADLKNDQIKPGAYYATRYYRKAYTTSDGERLRIRPSSIANLDDVPAFVMFDIFVHNKDRNGGNTILIPLNGDIARYRYLLIDHGHCFGGPAWDSDSASNLSYELAGVPWYTNSITDESDFVDPAARMAGLCEADIDAARDGLPDEWNIPVDDYKALRNSMSSRDRDMMLNIARDNMSIFAVMKEPVDTGRGT